MGQAGKTIGGFGEAPVRSNAGQQLKHLKPTRPPDLSGSLPTATRSMTVLYVCSFQELEAAVFDDARNILPHVSSISSWAE